MSTHCLFHDWPCITLHACIISKDRCLALFVIDDVLEFVGEDAAPEYMASYFPILLRCAVEPTAITAQVSTGNWLGCVFICQHERT